MASKQYGLVTNAQLEQEIRQLKQKINRQRVRKYRPMPKRFFNWFAQAGKAVPRQQTPVIQQQPRQIVYRQRRQFEAVDRHRPELINFFEHQDRLFAWDEDSTELGGILDTNKRSGGRTSSLFGF